MNTQKLAYTESKQAWYVETPLKKIPERHGAAPKLLLPATPCGNNAASNFTEL